MERVYSSNYLIGSFGESIAQKELRLRRLHIVNMKKLEQAVDNGLLPRTHLQVLHSYDHVVDLFKIIEDENGARIELYEVKTLVAGSVNTRRKKLKIGWKTVDLFHVAQKLQIPMFVVIVLLYPSWRYRYTVKPLVLEDFRIDEGQSRR